MHYELLRRTKNVRWGNQGILGVGNRHDNNYDNRRLLIPSGGSTNYFEVPQRTSSYALLDEVHCDIKPQLKDTN